MRRLGQRDQVVGPGAEGLLHEAVGAAGVEHDERRAALKLPGQIRDPLEDPVVLAIAREDHEVDVGRRGREGRPEVGRIRQSGLGDTGARRERLLDRP